MPVTKLPTVRAELTWEWRDTLDPAMVLFENLCNAVIARICDECSKGRRMLQQKKRGAARPAVSNACLTGEMTPTVSIMLTLFPLAWYVIGRGNESRRNSQIHLQARSPV